MKYRRAILSFVVSIFISQVYILSASAFLEKRYGYRLKDNRPPFRQNYTEGKFYLGIGYSWTRGRAQDLRSMGFEEFYNKQLYKALYNYSVISSQNIEQLKFSSAVRGVSSGIGVAGYSPTKGILSITRHELEGGAMSFSRNIPYVNEANKFCGNIENCLPGDGYSALDYSIKQKYLAYNLYIQPFKERNLNFFIGGGVGGVLSNAYLNGRDSTINQASGFTGNAGASKNAFSYMYIGFIGATYDINESLVLQGKLKAITINKPYRRVSRRLTFEPIVYSDPQYKGHGIMLRTIGFEITGIFG